MEVRETTYGWLVPRLLVLAATAALMLLATLTLAQPAAAQAPSACPPGDFVPTPPEGKSGCRPLCDTDNTHPAFDLTATIDVASTGTGQIDATAVTPLVTGDYANKGDPDCADDTGGSNPWTWSVEQACTNIHCVFWHTLVVGGNVVPSTAVATATPDASSDFLGWSSECAPPKNPADDRTLCAVRMDIDRSIAAEFGTDPDAQAPSPAPVASKVEAKRYEITLGWTASADETWLGGYEILRDGVVRYRAAPGATSLRATSLLCNRAYTWQVRAFDSLNAATSNEVSIKTGACAKVPPNTVLHVVPQKRSRARQAFFHWGATRRGAELSRFKSQCKLGRRAWKTCAPGKTYRNLQPGWKTVRIRTGDSQGWDRTPAKYSWLVRR
jgi:hypothetical protein